MDPGHAEAAPSHTGTIVGMALLSLAKCVAVKAPGECSCFCDELYPIACSKHLAAGHVDQPPLSIFLKGQQT